MERQDRERRKEEERLMREKQREEERTRREQRREMERREKFLQKEYLRVSEEPTSVPCSLSSIETVDNFLLCFPVLHSLHIYLKAEKRRQKEELRKEKEAVRRKAALEKATARRIARESMELIEDEQLELMELAAARKGLSSIVSLDHDTLQGLESLRGRLAIGPLWKFFFNAHEAKKLYFSECSLLY